MQTDIQFIMRTDHMMRLSCLPEQLVRRSEQLVLMDTKRILLDLLRMFALAKLLIHLSSAHIISRETDGLHFIPVQTLDSET